MQWLDSDDDAALWHLPWIDMVTR